ncbi:helix-turn-helix transcriptional regulator [Phragmitibacter flavus]|uniref:Helix-turn-helix transcriptional regulator n=1 Tax=Phragmitibacter flavus TaxID=2576071 RepID=A0A5R8K713_9BACT|nr:helix-turn-helix transcriptional regulator [Phragmitibacter flavus]TLD68160.1 helix-turn-helix transcriptional regulator [Phragmitibacter flavus]
MPSPDPVLSKFGIHVRNLRETQDLTQEQLAERAKLDITYISGIERGLRNPSLLSLLRLAKALGVSLKQLTEGVEL